ncbi:hypothetical protein [Nostoc sp. 'Peltigera membranacea cyanobiont' 232]|uniref:hypothetical protein n=1 Tax=Nostoc sp. 'Peltigera membranacea cyanobiont' 232 TaxID=2014531 RepID=UPI000B959444|nr:hypothetical protein [Nostoc sp. 'Peltigera membranacea cyanobiont' 232]OYE01427.1 hypothetical protein CDG79_29510 [Nostoc sp. 'Peltigera membranacea cyanobiont' 232]
MEPNQLDLFSDLPLTPALLTEGLVMSQEALLKWKAQIFDYQQKVRESKPPQQTTYIIPARTLYLLIRGLWV